MALAMTSGQYVNYMVPGAKSSPHCNPVFQLPTFHAPQTGFKTLSKAVKRRSAVERLEASKANYVKSEKVLDAKQKLRHSSHLKVTGTAPSVEVIKNTWKQWAPANGTLPKVHMQNGDSTIGCPVAPVDCPTANALPPKSPAFNRSKGRTNKDDHKARSRREDFQLKLRKLISSRDNSSESEYSNQSRGCPIIQPRAQQDVNYNLHKSMPDLNKEQPCVAQAIDCIHSATNSSSYGNVSKTLNRSHRATSDYVSRSPSCHQQHRDESCDSASSGNDLSAHNCAPSGQLTALSKRRPIFRSKSDISYRYSKEPYVDSMKKVQKCSPELERFFDSMGLDATELSTLCNSQPLSPSNYFESVSSIDSNERWGSVAADDDSFSDVKSCGRSIGLKDSDLKKNGPTETSIIERNARIIKWLYNCRKSLQQP